LWREVLRRISQPLQNHQSAVTGQRFDYVDVEHTASMLKSYLTV
jgi:hypothetical protein